MKQEELMKEALMKGAKKFYSQSDINALLASQVVSFLNKYE